MEPRQRPALITLCSLFALNCGSPIPVPKQRKPANSPAPTIAIKMRPRPTAKPTTKEEIDEALSAFYEGVERLDSYNTQCPPEGIRIGVIRTKYTQSVVGYNWRIAVVDGQVVGAHVVYGIDDELNGLSEEESEEYWKNVEETTVHVIVLPQSSSANVVTTIHKRFDSKYEGLGKKISMEDSIATKQATQSWQAQFSRIVEECENQKPERQHTRLWTVDPTEFEVRE